MLAIQNNNLELVKILIDYQTHINQTDEKLNTPLMYAANQGNKEIVELLLKVDNIDVNAANDHGRTALMFAASKGQIEIIQCLIKSNADIQLRDLLGSRAIDLTFDKSIKLLLFSP